MEGVEDVESSLTPREYQIEILEAAVKQNTIACLGTGTGKTFIAVMLIKEMAHHVQVPFADGGKRIFFLVPTVPLVHQQSQFIRKHTELNVKGYMGEMNVDSWEKGCWIKEFENVHVLVMTADICKAILHHNFLPVSRICLLILDECHQARGKHPYCAIMEHITSSNVEPKPRIFGLSASLVNGKCKPKDLVKHNKSLEQILQSKIVTLNDYADVLKYGSDPQQHIVHYSKNSYVAPEYTVILNYMSRCLEELKQERKISKTYGDELSQKPEYCVSQVIRVLENMGPWCAQRVAKVLSRGIEDMCIRADETKRIVLNKAKYILQRFIEVYDSHNVNHVDNNFVVVSDKLKKLMEVFTTLKKTFNKEKDAESTSRVENKNFDQNPYLYAQNLKVPKSGGSMCGIIFVHQRIDAYALCNWLQLLSKMNDDFNFIKAGYILGQGMTQYEIASEFFMDAKKQKYIIKKFHNKTYNVLVSTSVIEEGLDVQKCNFVIHFDFPKSDKSYIQAKGRARAKDSIYFPFVEEGNLSCLTDLNNFKENEQMLKAQNIIRDDLPTSKLDYDLVPPYMPVTPGPKITLNSATSLINRYCTILPCDLTVKLVPHYAFEEVNSYSGTKEFMCTLRLPINSPLHEATVGLRMRTKKLARMSAALEACKKLHKIGELDDHLLPMGNIVDIAACELGVTDKENASTCDNNLGTNKHEQHYEKGIASVFKNSLPAAGDTCFLHVFVLNLVVPLPACLNREKRPVIDPSDSSIDFGILLTKKLPKTCMFPIFTECGKILVDIKCVDPPFSFDENQISHIAKFHQFVFEDALCVTEPCMEFCPELSEFSGYVVPVNRDHLSNYYVDISTIQRCLEHNYNKEKVLTSKQIPRNRFEADLFNEAVVIMPFCVDKWENQKPTFYYISQIDYSLSPLSYLMDDKNLTLKAYYENEYNIDIFYKEQPLLRVDKCQSFDVSKPIYTSIEQVFEDAAKLSNKQKSNSKGSLEYLVPELCIIHPFPAPLFRKATYLPTVLYRLNCLLVSNELRQVIARVCLAGMTCLPDNFEWPIFNFESSDESLRQYLVSKGHVEVEKYSFFEEPAKDILKDNDRKICSFEAKLDIANHPGPSPSLLLQALTTKNANDEFSSERLQILGNAFVKYAISIKLYSKYPKFDERKLTKLRERLTENLNLYKLSKNRNLPSAMVHVPFCCDSRIKGIAKNDKEVPSNWLPPCFKLKAKHPPPVYEQDYSIQIVDTNEISKKRVANDSVCLPAKKQNLSKPYNEETREQSNRDELNFSYQQISDKFVAHSAEALVAAYLLSSGYQAALRFMWWFGINPFMESKNDSSNFENWPLKIENSLHLAVRNKEHFLNLKEFESRIKYSFSCPSYLLEAFTHASYCMYSNDITDSYQRLEFLGGAILDYLITRCLYEGPMKYTAEDLTKLRSALVNNAYLACLSIRYGFFKNLRSLSITLGRLINQYVGMLEDSEEFKHFEEYGYYLEEIECLSVDDVEIPKALSDIFKSVAGAIYLDSGSSLDTVWKIYYPIMKPAIDHMCVCIPKSPVEELCDLTNNRNPFKDVQVDGDKTYIRIVLQDGKEFVGIGPNKKVAKMSAAKQTVLYLKESGQF